MAHRVLFLPGDGVGPELLAAAQVVLRATGVRLKVETMDYGRSYERTHGRV
jgi:isocitrate/isopropylmalate dehydrogenase